MPADAPPDPPRLLMREIAALREDLLAAEYLSATLSALIGPVAESALDREDPVPALLELRRHEDPAADLFVLLSLGRRLPRRRAERALVHLGLAGAERLGLLEVDGEEVRPLLELSPCAVHDDLGEVEWWIASDLSELATGNPLGPEHVMGVGGATLTLARLTPRDRVDRALDLGCGSGIQALLATRHADHVVATDLSERALAFAAFTAAVNQVEIDLRQGSLWDPVAGEDFDLVVSNPPFVITPRSTDEATFTYRDGGRPGDTLQAQLIADLPAHLRPGGTAVMLGNWEIPREADWDLHPRAWIDGTDLDAWVIQRELVDPAQYAGTWARDGGVLPRDARWEQLVAAWLEDFADRGTARIGFGYLLLQRPRDPRTPILVTEELGGTGSGALGEHVAQTLRRRDLLTGMDDEQLLETRPVRAEDLIERRHLTPGEPHPRIIELVQGAGFARIEPVDQLIAAVVGACDGTLTLGQIIGAVCALTDTDPEEAHGALLPRLRSLIAAGMLEAS